MGILLIVDLFFDSFEDDLDALDAELSASRASKSEIADLQTRLIANELGISVKNVLFTGEEKIGKIKVMIYKTSAGVYLVELENSNIKTIVKEQNNELN